MEIYDISVPLSPELPVFPGDPRVEIEPVSRIAGGDTANVSRLCISTHSGTHIDPPRHFDDSGIAADALPLSLLVGDAFLADLSGAKVLGHAELAQLPLAGVKRLLLKTGNSVLWGRREFVADFAHLAPDGARYLADMGIRLIGMDYMSVERIDGDWEVHRFLLDNGIVILEGLDLSGVHQGDYELICLPLKIAGGDGAPARALLRAKAPPDPVPHAAGWPPA